MTKSETKTKAIEMLADSGYTFKGDTLTAPDAQYPLDAISIQNQLSEITYFENGEEYCFQLRYEGGKLKLINEEL